MSEQSTLDSRTTAPWKLADEAPEDGREVLACFKGQHTWVVFLARAYPRSHGGLRATGYASPTHWTDLPKLPAS